MFIGSGESIESIQSSQSISICTIFWFISYFSYLLHQWEKNEQLNKRWKNTKSQQVEHFDFLRVESSLRTCWRFEIEKTGKKAKPTSQKLSIFEAKNRRIQKKSRKKMESRKIKTNKKNEKLKSRKVRRPRDLCSKSRTLLDVLQEVSP
jgi:hypothetical protein